MKVKRLIPVITTLLVAGCSGEQLPQQEESTTHLSIQVGVESRGRAVAVEGSEFTHEAAIQIILLDRTKGSTAYDGVMQPYTYKKPTDVPGVWIPSKTALALNDNKADVFAHYPAVLPPESSLSADKKTLTVNLEPNRAYGTPDTYDSGNSFWFSFKAGEDEQEVRLADGEVDYLTGAGANPVDRNTKNTSIAMRHAFGMVVVKTYRALENTNPGILKSVTIKSRDGGTSVLNMGSFNIATTAYTPNATPIAYYREMDDFVDGCYFALMVYPATFADGEVELTVAVDEATYTMPIKSLCTWEAGKMVLYNVKLMATKATLDESVNVLPWPDLSPDNSHEFPLD